MPALLSRATGQDALGDWAHARMLDNAWRERTKWPTELFALAGPTATMP